ATTSGAADSAAKADWRPLSSRKIYIWPDHDEAGQRYATAVTDTLLALNCTVVAIDVTALHLPPKGDVVDWLAANPNVTAQEIFALPTLSKDLPYIPPVDRSYHMVELIQGSSLKPEPVEWFWPGWLAAGKVHVLGGAPGTGKTTLSMAFAATLT